MKKTIENYVFPVCCGTKDGESDGCGVLVGDLFVTAGHVIEHSMVAHVYQAPWHLPKTHRPLMTT